jgi:putative flippase GtrA
MKDLLKSSIPIIIGTAIGFGITKLLGICVGFIYNHFGETGVYIVGFVGSVIVGTIVNYVVHKYVFDKGK